MAETKYQVLTQYNSPNYTPYAQVPSVYGMSRVITGVVYHWWGDPAQNPQFLNIISWLCRSNGNSSAHTVGEGNRVAWIVDAINAAWHAGNARGNALYVGYECNPRLSDEDYQTMGEFHYDMEVAYGRTLEIRVHKEFSNTSCSPIDKARIRRIADSLHYQAKGATEAEVKQAYRDILEREADAGGIKTYTTNGMTIAQVRADLMASNERKLLEARKKKEAEEAARPEWQRNLKDITDIKLSVLPAEGVKVLNLTTFVPVTGEVIPKGTQIDIVYETTVGGKKYYLSSYAFSKGLPWGILASALGTPVVEPPQEKPEWLKNLKDIADKDFWTRSETPVLNIENGEVVRKLPINTKVRITHSTSIVGTDYLVLEGGKEVVSTVYLSDTEIKNPTDDLEKRVSALEALVEKIVAFLSDLFTNFKTKIGK